MFKSGTELAVESLKYLDALSRSPLTLALLSLLLLLLPCIAVATGVVMAMAIVRYHRCGLHYGMATTHR